MHNAITQRRNDEENTQTHTQNGIQAQTHKHITHFWQKYTYSKFAGAKAAVSSSLLARIETHIIRFLSHKTNDIKPCHALHTHTHTQVNLLPSIGGLCFIFSFSDARAVFNIFRLFLRQPNLTLYNHRFELAHSEWMKMKHTIVFRWIWFGDVYKLKMRRHSLSHDMVRVWNEFWRDAVNDDEYFMFNSSFVCVCSRRTN